MQVRPLSDTDLDSFIELRLQGLKESPDSFLISYEQEKETGPSYFQELLGTENPDNIIFGFFMDDKLLGILGMFRDNLPKLSHRMNIWGLYVHPDVRRNGVAKALMKKSIDHAKKQERIFNIRLSVDSKNKKAIELYQKFGFVEWGVEPKATQGINELLDDVHMSLNLGES
ncbi:MAG: ribosomal protein S18 acetylase RimI-like enzyme [Bacteriovoracaceae bacterium]|jgi:ribosomal protein S18 acetylase RimI-like enzyme